MTSTKKEEQGNADESRQLTRSWFDAPFWSLGFRPFFLFGSIWGVFVLALWSTTLAGSLTIPGLHFLWHAHEMLHGFAIAIVIGFLSTATQNWTGIRGIHGVQLFGLVSIWAAGRLMMLIAAFLPLAAGLVDLAFLPACIWLLRVYFIKQKLRNIPLFVALSFLWLANLSYHLSMNGILSTNPRPSLYFATYIFIFMIVVIGGRVIPFFSSRVITNYVQKKAPILDRLGPLSSAIFAFTIFFSPSIAGAIIAAVAAITNTWRLVKWYDRRIWKQPILFILYIGFAWINAGFVAAAMAEISLLPQSTALHIFTVGAISTMILAMISRVSLGHTGRPIHASTSMQVAFACIIVAAILRSLSFIGSTTIFLVLSAVFWIIAFGLFIAVYAKKLVERDAKRNH